MYTTAFILSSTALLISIVGGLTFLFFWIKNPAHSGFLLPWAYGMFALLLFKIPNILINAGMTVAQKDFYPFFFVTMLAYFLSYFAFVRGLLVMGGLSYTRTTLPWFRVWFLSAVVYFGLTFFAPGFDVSYTPVWASHLFFFIPAQVFLFSVLFRTLRNSAGSFRPSGAGSTCVAAGTITLFFSSLLYVVLQTSAFKPDHWYYTIVSSPTISVLQTASALFLFVGFLLLARQYLRSSER